MLVRIVGLGPGDPGYLTVGSLGALRECAHAAALLAPPELAKALESNGIVLDRTLIPDGAALAHGSADAIAQLVGALRALPVESLGLGVLGNPLSDLPGLPPLLRALEDAGHTTRITPGMPHATLSASIAMPLVPLPPQSQHYSWDDLIEIMARLRDGCPWDREQTHRTLVPYLIEETYEVVEAIEAEDLDALCEELGDLLLQIVFHSQLGSETGKFTVADVV
ncbi:MAG TPA: MazG nucleotide pyrophosphohydrolase domain-containing protein, partial [Alphaproteobacteria bacterium]|nr:MazG nucleotide pyrophosphohydrolase domain-containing protein [Alphaproteobacteria bacterium]